MNQKDREHFLALSETELFARCLWGESRGEPIDGMVAVAAVIKNRVNGKTWYGVTLKNVILKPWQFSCFLPGDPNFERLKVGPSGKIFDQCKVIAELSTNNLLTDNTMSSTHYHVASMKNPPKWANMPDQMVFKRQIANHKFYEEI
jgi:N-acetylmuramoyl-L-alanine amidase